MMLFETSIFITTVRACQVGCARLRLTQLLTNALIINDINNIYYIPAWIVYYIGGIRIEHSIV